MNSDNYIIVFVRTQDGKKIHCRSDITVQKNECVIVKTDSGYESGKVISVKTYPKRSNPYSAWGENVVTEVVKKRS